MLERTLEERKPILVSLPLTWREAMCLQRIVKLQKELLGSEYDPLEAKLTAWFKQFAAAEEDYVKELK
jgi:hypothetical protein